MVFAVITFGIDAAGEISVELMPATELLTPDPDNPAWRAVIGLRHMIDNLTPESFTDAVRQHLRRIAQAPDAPPGRTYPLPTRADDNRSPDNPDTTSTNSKATARGRNGSHPACTPPTTKPTRNEPSRRSDAATELPPASE